jgi:flagellar motor switch protein FliG
MILNAGQGKNKLEGITGPQKAAMLLIVLGEQAAAAILPGLAEDDVQKVSREVAKITAISAEQAEAVLEQFHNLSTAGDYVARGGIEVARKLLLKAFSPDHAKRLLERLAKALGSEAASFDAIEKADPQQLAKFIHNEHPQTVALVLSHLNANQAAALLSSLPASLRADVSQRMASLDQISPEIIYKIAGVIGQKLKALGEFSRESYGGVRAVAEMLNRTDSATSREILDSIEQQDPNLGETIRHLMFVFEDLLLIDQMGLKEVLTKIDRKVLTVALKGTSEKLREHILACMSQRGGEMLKEDMDALGPVKIKDVEASQQQIISVVRQLESEGVLSLKGALGEQYVV